MWFCSRLLAKIKSKEQMLRHSWNQQIQCQFVPNRNFVWPLNIMIVNCCPFHYSTFVAAIHCLWIIWTVKREIPELAFLKRKYFLQVFVKECLIFGWFAVPFLSVFSITLCKYKNIQIETLSNCCICLVPLKSHLVSKFCWNCLDSELIFLFWLACLISSALLEGLPSQRCYPKALDLVVGFLRPN